MTHNRFCFYISLNRGNFNISPVARYSAITLSFFLCNQICILGHSLPSSVYYAIFIAVGILMLGVSRPSTITMYIPMFSLWIVMWLSIFVNYFDIPPEYRVVYRNISFFLVMMATGPFMTNHSLLEARYYMMNVCNLFFLLMVIVSFIGYFLHIFPSDIQGYYKGCIRHSMAMGCVSGITVVNCLHEFYQKHDKKLNRLFLVFAIAAFFTGLAAASRCALGASIVACVAYLLVSHKGHYSRAIIFSSLFLAFLLISVNYIKVDIFAGISNKMHNSYSLDNMTRSRESIWIDRMNEFSDSPILGVGAHSIRPELCKTNQRNEAGVVEPGNAWLFFLSSTGILGFILFTYIYFSSIIRCWKKSTPFSDGALLFAQLVFFGVYMNAEAHITASGDYSFMYFWIIIAMTLQQALSCMNKNRLSLLAFIQRS